MNLCNEEDKDNKMYFVNAWLVGFMSKEFFIIGQRLLLHVFWGLSSCHKCIIKESCIWRSITLVKNYNGCKSMPQDLVNVLMKPWLNVMNILLTSRHKKLLEEVGSSQEHMSAYIQIDRLAQRRETVPIYI